MNIPTRFLSLVLTAIFAFSIYGNAASPDKKFTIVIDPGHGGRDPGAVNGKLLEKDLNLAVALSFGRLITKDMPDVRVLYTRSDDRFVALAERGALANRQEADLFISIHMDSFTNSSANGSSTWVMGMETSEANLAEAMRENEVIKYESDYSETYQGFDPSSAESYIIFSLMQYAHFDSSLQFARIIQKHYTANTPVRNRGAAQKPLLVLWKTTMPSVLTEVGFMSNEADRRFISSSAGQAKVARALYDALGEYRRSIPETITAPVPTASDSGKSTTPEATGAADSSAFYVQLTATRTRMKTSDRSFGEYRGAVVEKESGGWYKYSLGPYSTLKEAEKARDKARKGKFKDAFIVQ